MTTRIPYLRGYSLSLAAVSLAVLGTFAIRPWMGTSVSILFFPAVMITAMYGGYGPALLATVLSSCALAFLFIPPHYTIDIGADDLIRVVVFAAVALITASLASAQRRAELAQRRALDESRDALRTLRKVSGWPVFVDSTLAGAAVRLLEHAASVLGSQAAIAVWEAEDEPWVYMADSSAGETVVRRFAPHELEHIVPAELERTTIVTDKAGGAGAFLVSRDGVLTAWKEPIAHSHVAARLGDGALASAPFTVEHLAGRLFFSGLAGPSSEIIPLAEVVAREVGNSLEHLHLHDRLQQVAIREDRIRVARDLHDGVLQSLTGIRFRLQALADEQDAPSAVRDRLLAVERAIAIEQRELRLFIEDLRPVPRRREADGTVAAALEDLRARLAAEWSTPIAIRVSPPELSLSKEAEQTLRFVVREASVNALKHAHPSRVSVEVVHDPPAWLRITVANDGRGFQFRGRMEHEELVAANAGPVSLRERLASAGGTLAIESTATGSRLEIALPLAT
jgi:signal transduction histidine kinase